MQHTVYTENNIKTAIYSVHHKYCNIQCTLYRVQYKDCNIQWHCQCTLYSVHYKYCNIHSTLYIIPRPGYFYRGTICEGSPCTDVYLCDWSLSMVLWFCLSAQLVTSLLKLIENIGCGIMSVSHKLKLELTPWSHVSPT